MYVCVCVCKITWHTSLPITTMFSQNSNITSIAHFDTASNNPGYVGKVHPTLQCYLLNFGYTTTKQPTSLHNTIKIKITQHNKIKSKSSRCGKMCSSTHTHTERNDTSCVILSLWEAPKVYLLPLNENTATPQ